MKSVKILLAVAVAGVFLFIGGFNAPAMQTDTLGGNLNKFSMPDNTGKQIVVAYPSQPPDPKDPADQR